jgi:hypothetical protein
MDELNAVRIRHAQHRGLRQKRLYPVRVIRKEPEQARPLGQPWEPGPLVGCQPAVERPLATPFHHEAQCQGHNFTRVQVGLWMFRLGREPFVDPYEQANDKISSGPTTLRGSDV